jgi:membrane-bound acyltransferase YfiQ involved in biofilm formation
MHTLHGTATNNWFIGGAQNLTGNNLSCLGWVFNFKLGYFSTKRKKCVICTQPIFQLKTLSRMIAAWYVLFLCTHPISQEQITSLLGVRNVQLVGLFVLCLGSVFKFKLGWFAKKHAKLILLQGASFRVAPPPLFGPVLTYWKRNISKVSFL